MIRIAKKIFIENVLQQKEIWVWVYGYRFKLVSIKFNQRDKNRFFFLFPSSFLYSFLFFQYMFTVGIMFSRRRRSVESICDCLTKNYMEMRKLENCIDGGRENSNFFLSFRWLGFRFKNPFIIMCWILPIIITLPCFYDFIAPNIFMWTNYRPRDLALACDINSNLPLSLTHTLSISDEEPINSKFQCSVDLKW